MFRKRKTQKERESFKKRLAMIIEENEKAFDVRISEIELSVKANSQLDTPDSMRKKLNRLFCYNDFDIGKMIDEFGESFFKDMPTFKAIPITKEELEKYFPKAYVENVYRWTKKQHNRKIDQSGLTQHSITFIINDVGELSVWKTC